ncbi:AT-rich interactive domain-containing protein 4B-like isoform X2 [Physella acuta]|uniref:AT-rich interactive domain-containing protein 4B-like isoform X2 n=1 Tax=Physella acuta TaxID=109671 RepID=UPI0027DE00D7|nr:AT-rich interactive domain-containing protein 4B-like isoform X2 [Physella acuta]
MAQPGFGPPSLPVGTEVSAKYRGAFCEAKVKNVVRVVKCKVMVKDYQSSIFVNDDEIKGTIKLGAVVEVKHPETGQPVEATINKLIDHSTYTVVFDDGDERTLRRTQLCLKGDKHFIESETLDNLPLSHPEHFGTPVLQNKKSKRKHDGASDGEEESDEEESPRRATYRGRHQELVGKLMLVDLPHRKGSLIPALVVLPDANSLNEVKNRDQILVRSFKDSKFMVVTRKDLKDFSRVVAIKNEDKTMRTAIEKALLYFDTKELPVGWDKEEMLGSDCDDNEDGEEENEYASEDEPFEEKDRFVAQLYKFMDDRGTPINKGPCIGNKDLNLYKLFKIVQNLGGYNKVTKEMKWSVVYSKMGLPSLHQNPAHQIKTAYKKYLDAYETFYRKLGSTMGTLSRPGRARQNSSRSILNFRGRERSPRSPKPPEKVKEDTESPKRKIEVSPDKPEEADAATNMGEDGDVMTRRTPRRDARTLTVKEEKDKKEDVQKGKKEDKKDEVNKAKKEDSVAPKGKKESVSSATKTDVVKVKEESVKKEDRKSSRKKEVDEKEVEKDEKKTDKGKLMKEEEKKEMKVESPVPQDKESPKKRVTRRKLMVTDLKESELKEEEDKKEATKKPLIKENKVIEKPGDKKEIPKTLERRDFKSLEKKDTGAKSVEKKDTKSGEKKPKLNDDKKQKKEKRKDEKMDDALDISSNNMVSQAGQSDEEDESDVEKPVTDPKLDFPIGSRLKVKYGRGKNKKIYIAKVVDFGKDGLHKTYLVHYAGWNTRYDEWIRADRVVSILDKPSDGENKVKTPPSRPPFSATMKKIGNGTKPTGLKKSGQIFRTPKMIRAKTRATRSSSSDTSVVSKGSDSHMSSDAEDNTGSERADDEDENTKSDKEEEDDILNVEEDEEAEREKCDLDTSLEEGEIPVKTIVAPETGSERIENEESEVKIKQKDQCDVDQPGEDVSHLAENTSEGKKDSKEKLEHAKETPAKTVTEVVKKFVSEVKHERASVVVSEVNNAVDEIRSAVYQGELEPEEKTDVKPEPNSVDTPTPSSDSTPEISEKPEELDKEKCLNEITNLKSPGPSIVELCASPADEEQALKSKTEPPVEQDNKECEKPKAGRGRKKEIPSKEVKRPFKTLDMSGTNLAGDAPSLAPVSLEPVPAACGATTGKTEPSPYDFDVEVETSWQREITKKWEPSQKGAPNVKDPKDSLSAADEGEEKDKKKVKKKTKRKSQSSEQVVDKEGEEPVTTTPLAPSVKDEAQPSPVSVDVAIDKVAPKKKGRKKKELVTETKKEVIEQYESTVNSVVEAVKHSLQETESDHEQRPMVKRRRMKRASESDKKDTSVRQLKVGRKIAGRDLLEGFLQVNSEDDKKDCPSNSHNEALSQSLPILDSACGSSLVEDNENSLPQKERRKEASFSESQGFEPQPEQPDANAPFDNTPPTTPEHDEEAHGAIHHQPNVYNNDDLALKSDIKDSAKAVCPSSSASSISLPIPISNHVTAKSASESPSDNDVTSTTSTDNFDTTPTAQQSESSGTDQDVPSNKKRKTAEDILNGILGPKKKKRIHGTRSRTAQKSPKYLGNSDSQNSASNTPNHCPESPPTKFPDLSKSPRPSKYNFSADLGEYLEGEARCNFLISKMKEIKSIYMNLKSEVASIDRRRKRARRKERESSQVSPNDRDTST